MMQQTGIWHCFPFLFLLFTLHLSPILAYVLKDCTILYSENVTADVSVHCEKRQLFSIPDDIPREVTSLTLKDNHIQKISRTDLKNLMNLRELSLGFNSIIHVDDGSFGHLGELKVLLMNNNQLTTLTDNMFQGLSNLLLLCLDWNNIQSISPAAFQSLPCLQELYLIANYIHQITDIITILQLPRLHVLEITIKELVSFQSNDLPLNMSSELRELQLDSTSIKKLSITTAVFPNLKKIDLTNCCNLSGWEWHIPHKHFLRNITHVYFGDERSFNAIRTSLQNLDSLQYLRLSSMWKNRGLLNIACNISTLRTLELLTSRAPNVSELTTCTQLTNLYLVSSTDLTELPKDSINQIKQLNQLNLTHSKQLSKRPFKSLKSLEHLEVGSDGKNGWLYDGPFEGPVGLKYLTLQGFRLEGTESKGEVEINVFEGLDELETLSLFFLLSYRDLPLLTSLKSLTIQCNHQLFTPNITYITFKNTPNLEVLDLSNNKLKSLDFLEQSNLTRVSWLDLSQNELTVINISVFSFLPALRYINMGGNPFACECSNSDVLQWILNNSQTQVVDAHSYTCGYPLMKKGTRFLDFDIHSCWMDASFICYISSTCVIVVTLLTSFTYHFLRWQLLYAYFLFLAFLYDAQNRKRGSPQRYDAFISYNVHDEPWVYREMLPVLEGEQGWRLCLHHRDFQPGKAIIENITEAIYGSRKTICVISHRYLESEWCSREIQMASYRLFDEKKDVLILVFLEDIPAQQLSPYFRMRRLVKRHTYLSWSQAGQHPGLFWQNLRRALDTPDTDLCLDE